MSSNPLPESVIEAIRNELVRVRQGKEHAIRIAAEPWDNKERELTSFLSSLATGATDANESAVAEEAESISAKIKAMAKSLILPGVFVTTQEIHEALVGGGVQFPSTGLQPHQRITKVVSATNLYRGNKYKGWSLKSTAASSSTEEEEEEDEDLF